MACPDDPPGQTRHGGQSLSGTRLRGGAEVGELVLTTPQRVRRTDRIGIQSPSLFPPPTGTGCVAAM